MRTHAGMGSHPPGRFIQDGAHRPLPADARENENPVEERFVGSWIRGWPEGRGGEGRGKGQKKVGGLRGKGQGGD